ncbi:hypothetical protein [Mesorhizobium sp. M7A.F.Ca.US.010.02.1.1]|uniref:hypothetical protein n=1 Tax=unclassified Mesorhizobium TaxID=325217 RepID=UPI000FD4E2F3|nr:hypothetical protein [Mesorhizobium sp. M7A.F.Ca.US.010.02.1.1]RUW92788.1 hypothetical protein EOA19_10485 [Mesorhizobium sp. M7A.F.Ca.US.010.02.1.1]
MKNSVLAGYILFFLALLPGWAVHTAATQSRVGWFGAVIFFGFIGLFAVLSTRAYPGTDRKPGPFARRYGGYLCVFIFATFLSGESLAIALTYGEPDQGFIGEIGSILSALGSYLFPVVAKYANSIQPPLSDKSIFRAQSIITCFLFAGFISSISIFIYYVAMPKNEITERLNAGGRKRPNTLTAFAGVIFGILTSLSAYFGIDEFQTKTEHCWLNAACYTAGDDLTLFWAAVGKIVMMFFFPLGGLAMLVARRTLPEN